MLDKYISINQSAFVPGQSILDNPMVTIEIVHYMKAKAKGKSRFFRIVHYISQLLF